jgi:flagellar export protein FliJ
MAFRFSLAIVLRFRESVEKREELALQKILQDIGRVRQQIADLTVQIERALDARNGALLKPIAAAQLQGVLIAIETAKESRKQLIASLEPLELRRQEQTKVYQAAHRDRQMLSDMEERARSAYEQEHTRKQQKFLDDVFAARAQRT